MRVSDFFAPRSATPDTRSEAEATLRNTAGNDATSETPTTEIVSGEGDAVLHDTIVQDEPVAEGVPGFSGDSVPETVKSCGCPEGECRGPNPETVSAAVSAAEDKARAEGVNPGDARFGEILQEVMTETFGEGVVTVSGPLSDEELAAAEASSTGMSLGYEVSDAPSLDEEKFFQELLELIGKAPPQNVQTGYGTMQMPEGLLEAILGSPRRDGDSLIARRPSIEDTFANTERPDPFPFFSSLGRDEPDYSRLHIDEEDDKSFEQEGREVVQSLTATMEQLVRLATTVYGE
jgi:hypothetical protein